MISKSFLAVLTVVLSACGATAGGQAEPGTLRERLFEATATVLSSTEHGPMLCFGAIADSLPPQCGDIPITNWDWQRAEGEQRAAGTTWGSYRVIGTYDGNAFTVSDVGSVEVTDPPIDDNPSDTPCEKPESGWPVPDSSPRRR